jgi:cytoskeletal protein CcmA (bactofilin family)
MAQRGWIRRTIETPAAQDAAPDEQATPPRPEASIAAGCEVEGRLALEGPLTVHGDFKGAIECHLDVIVAEGGTVQGPIRARSIEVIGSVVGDLDARREIVLHAGGRLHGDVTAASLVVERGACFEGRSTRLQPIAPRPALDASADGADAGAQTPSAGLAPPPPPSR